MANHQSAKKRIVQSEKRRVHNKYYAKTMRNALKKLRLSHDKDEVTKMVPSLSAMIDKLVKKNIIHKNKAANLKSQVMRRANAL